MFKDYTFFASSELGNRELHPNFEDLRFTWTREKSEVFYRKKLNSDLIFHGEDYEYLRRHDCERIELIINYKGNQVYTGFLRIVDGIWDEDLCEVSISPVTIDEYTCLFEKWETEYNILSGVTKQTIRSSIGEIEVIECEEKFVGRDSSFFPSSPPKNTDCINQEEKWGVLSNELRAIFQREDGSWDYFVKTSWVRERIEANEEPPGGDWINIEGNVWVRRVNLIFDFESFVGYTKEGGRIVQRNIVFEGQEIDNGVLLSDVLELLIQDCELSVKSDFFNINPEGDAPENQAYENAPSDFVVWQKTDIKFHYAFNNASIARTTAKKFLGILGVFNIRFAVQNRQLIIEHLSFFESNNGLDLTESEATKGLSRYQYNKGAIPRFERFRWSDTVSQLFEGFPIEYDTNCTDGTEDVNQYNELTTDINYIIQNPDLIANEGFVFAKIDRYEGRFFIARDRHAVQNRTGLNYAFSFPNIHENFWKHGRKRPVGIMNDNPTTFVTSDKQKRQNDIEIVGSLDFAPEQLIKTELGWGEVDRAEYSAKACYLNLTLLHD